MMVDTFVLASNTEADQWGAVAQVAQTYNASWQKYKPVYLSAMYNF